MIMDAIVKNGKFTTKPAIGGTYQHKISGCIVEVGAAYETGVVLCSEKVETADDFVGQYKQVKKANE